MGGVVTPGGPGQFLGGQSGTGGKIAGFVVNLISGVSFKAIRDRAKAKKALAIANAGGYNTLTPYQKSLISQSSAGFYSATPENAGNFLDLTSVLIFLVVGVVLFFLLRSPGSRHRT